MRTRPEDAVVERERVRFEGESMRRVRKEQKEHALSAGTMEDHWVTSFTESASLTECRPIIAGSTL